MAVMNFGQSILSSVGQLAVMLLAAHQVVKGQITVGDFVLVNTYVMQIMTPLNNLGRS
ncbi:hypothetical protein AKO1_001261, partial [Acrasis kona]